MAGVAVRVIKQDGDYAPDTWKGLKLADGTRSASYVCPNGHEMVLINHTISLDGMVTPSVVCPQGGCGFHEYLLLQGWTPEAVAA